MKKDMSGFKVLEYKQDYEETVRRYNAFWEGEIIDRPIVMVTAPNPHVDGEPITITVFMMTWTPLYKG